MTLLELVKHLRQSILDDVGGTNVAWEDISEDDDDVAQLRWSNEELTRFVNESQKQACRASYLLKSANSDFEIDVVAGTSTYDLNPKILKIKGAYLASNGKEITEVEYEDVMGIQNWRTKTGTPQHYIQDMNTNEILLYPQPEIADTVYILAYHLPLEDMSWDNADADSPAIREEHQIEMLYYAAYLAYLKDEANTFDPQRAEYNRQLFEKNFSNNSAYTETRRSRTRNRSVTYRDI